MEDGILSVLICKKPGDILEAETIARHYDVVLITHSCLRHNDKTHKSPLKVEGISGVHQIYVFY